MGICGAKGKPKEPELKTRDGFLKEEVAMDFKVDMSNVCNLRL